MDEERWKRNSQNRPKRLLRAVTKKHKHDPAPNPITVLAHPSGTDTLNPPAAPVAAGPGPFGGYYKVTGYAPEGAAREITVSNDELVIHNDGVFILPIGWGGFRHSGNNATVAFVLGIERAGQILFSQRPTADSQANLDKIDNISGGGQFEAQAGDKVSAWVASDLAGTLTVGNSNITVHMLEDTTP